MSGESDGMEETMMANYPNDDAPEYSSEYKVHDKRHYVRVWQGPG